MRTSGEHFNRKKKMLNMKFNQTFSVPSIKLVKFEL